MELIQCDKGPDEQRIVELLLENNNQLTKNMLKIAILPDSKRVHVFVLKNMDEDDINSSAIYEYVRNFGYRDSYFASEIVKVEEVAI